VDRCCAATEIGGRLIPCEREHGHGGAHTARVDDPGDPYTYVVSWFPSNSTPEQTTFTFTATTASCSV